MTAAHFDLCQLPEIRDDSGVGATRLHDCEALAHDEQSNGIRYLVVRVGDLVNCYAYPLDTDRVVAIGNADNVELRLAHRNVGSLLCYFERIGDAVWLIPAYISSVLRVDAACVAGPQPLGEQALIEYEDWVLRIEWGTLPPSGIALESNWQSAPDALALACKTDRLPKPDDITRLPWSLKRAARLGVADPASSGLPACGQTSHEHVTRVQGITSLTRTLRGIAPDAVDGNAIQHRPNHDCADLAHPGAHNERALPVLSQCDWLYAIGRRAKYRPLQTRLLAIVLALLSAAIVVTVARVYLQRTGF